MTRQTATKRTTRTVRPSKGVDAALKADAPTMQLPTVTTPAPIRPTLDDLVTELRPTVFRLLDAGRLRAAAELVATYADEADRALWGEVLDR